MTSPPIADGCVEIDGPCIVSVGRTDRKQGGTGVSPASSSPRLLDLGQAILTPGLVNPHTHLELTAYARQLEPAPFWKWIGRLVELRRQPGRVEREQQGVHDGAWQSLRAGVTCVGDISRENLAWPILKKVPIRKVCYAELLTLADQPPRNPDELRAAVEGIEEDELLTAGLSPHAPYTLPEEQFRAAIALAGRLGRPWCTHWAETPEEVAFLRGDTAALPRVVQMLLAQCGVRSPELTPVEYLERCAAGQPAGALAHMNYVMDAEIPRLAAAGHVVMYCPRAHRFFDHAPHPFVRMLAAGIPVALGTDSLASNQSLSLLEELKFVHENVADAPSPETLLRMATLDAARALRLEHQIGSLEPGKQADLAAFPCPPGCGDPITVLVKSAPAPLCVWVAGRR